MGRITKALKYLTGKMTDAMCPICGRWMTRAIYPGKYGDVNVWYCTNLQHDGTTRKIRFK